MDNTYYFFKKSKPFKYFTKYFEEIKKNICSPNLYIINHTASDKALLGQGRNRNAGIQSHSFPLHTSNKKYSLLLTNTSLSSVNYAGHLVLTLADYLTKLVYTLSTNLLSTS